MLSSVSAGPFTATTMQLNFCVRNDAETPDMYSRQDNWPVGNYCVYKAGGSCPAGWLVSNNIKKDL